MRKNENSFSMNRTPLIPSFSPTGGEGARRAVEGDSGRFMASIHVLILEAFPFHGPSMLRVADPRSGARLCEAQRFMVPMRVQNWRSRLPMNRLSKRGAILRATARGRSARKSRRGLNFFRKRSSNHA